MQSTINVGGKQLFPQRNEFLYNSLVEAGETVVAEESVVCAPPVVVPRQCGKYKFVRMTGQTIMV